MNRPLMLTLALAGSTLGSGTRAAEPAAPLEAAMAKLAASGFAGVVAATDRNGLLFERAVGFRDRERRKLHRADQVWPWASVTKQVTAALVMREVDAGRLSLETPVRSLLPDFPGASGNRITVRQLLQHTSGLPNPIETPKNSRGVPSFYTERGPGTQDEARSRTFCAGPPKAKPGASFSYNNCDYQLLGAVLQRITGRTYPELFRDVLGRPLALRSVRVAPDDAAHGGTDVVGYDGETRSPHMNFAALGAGGSLTGRARDLLAFDRALLAGRLASPASMAEMWKGNPKLGYAALGAWSFEARLQGCPAPVHLVERRGHFAGIQVRNLIAPQLGRAVVAFTNDGDFSFGEIWQGRGPTYDLASAAFCNG